MLKLAIVGVGHMGKLHLKNLGDSEITPMARLVCVCDTNPRTAGQVSRQYGVPAYFSVYEMMDKAQIDAVIVAATSTAHVEVAEALLKEGIPVLVEKPVAISCEDAEKLSAAVSKGKSLLSAGYTEVYSSITRGLMDYLHQDNEFEYLDFFRIGLKDPRNALKDIDVIQDLLIHDLSVLGEIAKISEAVFTGGTLFSLNEKSLKYDSASVSLQIGGRFIRFLVDRNNTVKIRKVHVSKQDFYGEFDFMDQVALIQRKGKIDAFGANIWYSQSFEALKVRYSNNPLLEEIKDFVTAVIEERPTRTSEKWLNLTLLTEKIRGELHKIIN